MIHDVYSYMIVGHGDEYVISYIVILSDDYLCYKLHEAKFTIVSYLIDLVVLGYGDLHDHCTCCLEMRSLVRFCI